MIHDYAGGGGGGGVPQQSQLRWKNEMKSYFGGGGVQLLTYNTMWVSQSIGNFILSDNQLSNWFVLLDEWMNNTTMWCLRLQAGDVWTSGNLVIQWYLLYNSNTGSTSLWNLQPSGCWTRCIKKQCKHSNTPRLMQWLKMSTNLTQLLPIRCANNRRSMIKSRLPL